MFALANFDLLNENVNPIIAIIALKWIRKDFSRLPLQNILSSDSQSFEFHRSLFFFFKL